MHVGRRVAKLRAAFGESLRDAALRTGVSHTTIARIEKGEVTGSFHSTLRKIAEGYGVRVEFLLTGRDPRRDFEQFLQRLSPEERGRIYFIPTHARVQLALSFLATEYPEELQGSPFAKSWGWTETSPQRLEELPADQVQQMAGVLARVTGIPEHWFHSGIAEDPFTTEVPPEMLSAYVAVVKKAALAAIHPETLEMAIDLLIMRYRATAVGLQA